MNSSQGERMLDDDQAYRNIAVASGVVSRVFVIHDETVLGEFDALSDAETAHAKSPMPIGARLCRLTDGVCLLRMTAAGWEFVSGEAWR